MTTAANNMTIGNVAAATNTATDRSWEHREADCQCCGANHGMFPPGEDTHAHRRNRARHNAVAAAVMELASGRGCLADVLGKVFDRGMHTQQLYPGGEREPWRS